MQNLVRRDVAAVERVIVVFIGRRLAPLRSTPANTPRDRDQLRISAVIIASVCACTVRPTGPAMAATSPPIVTLSFIRRFSPC